MKSKVPFVSILLNLITIPFLLFFLIFYDIPHQAVEKVYYWFKYETSHVPPKEISCENIPTEKLMVAATFGQSNAANLGGTPLPEIEKVFQFYKGRCYLAKDPLLGAAGHRGSVWTRLGRKVVSSGMYDNVLFLSNAIGTTEIAKWECGSAATQNLINSIKELKNKKFRPTHLMWHQGERDNFKRTSKENYKKSFLNMLSCVRVHTKAPVMVSVASYRFGVVNGNIREAQRELVDFTQNIFPGPDTDTLDQTYRRDNTHFNDLGLDRFAELWLEKIRSLP